MTNYAGDSDSSGMKAMLQISNRDLFLTIIAGIVTMIISMMFSACSTSQRQAPSTAASIDLSRYVGRWHEIARLPVPFEKPNEAAIAEYGSLPNGTLSVHNIAIRSDGSQHDIRGYAEVLNPPNNTKLSVRFNAWFAPFIPIPKEGNYWIFYVEENYQSAIVGTPDRKYLWILARTPKIPGDKLQDLLERAQKLGFDRSKMIFDPLLGFFS